MKIKNIFLLCLLGSAMPVDAAANKVEIKREGGNIVMLPMNDNAIRIQVAGSVGVQPDELIYVNKVENVKYSVCERGGTTTLKVKNMTAVYDAATDAIAFTDAKGKVLLKEISHGRTMRESEVQGEATTAVAQRFFSPADEYLFGTGQFQDGYVNVRGLSRRLTQVNTQISIPFVLSNKGYALLWNNYGLTEFNPASQSKVLNPVECMGKTITVDVTSTKGNKKETRNINAFEAEIEVAETGEYSILMDVGQRMARKHKVIIDGKTMVDINNLWLPSTTSFMTRLTKGRHKVVVEGEKRDKPTVYWRKNINETELRSPVSTGIDYTVFAGSPDEVIASYRQLSGNAPMMPLWAMGYIHCRERYKTQQELLENAKEFRKRDIPIDMIVQDWQYWGKYGWNAMRFDEENYPDPAQMVRELHNENIRLMISVWAKVDEESAVGAKAKELGYLLPGIDWVDFFNSKAADYYWANFSNGLLKPYGIDAWWQDATEPENDDLQGRRINNRQWPGEGYRNAFPMFVNRTVFTGLRKDAPEKRVMILTRSGFPGLQRYAAATWSGDVGHDWETLRRQIAGGLGQMAAGLPWWTFDAGGFFRPWNQYESPEYHEMFLRWLQVGAFLPLMRVHGYMSDTEPWRYGELVERVARKYITLRYSLMPYIYSNAARVTNEGYTIMRPLVMDFPDDEHALQQKYEYMFGSSLLVSPIVEPNVNSWTTYLPKSSDWYDFRTGKRYSGGTSVTTTESIETMPVFVRSGSIILMAQGKRYAADKSAAPLTIRIYPGRDCTFSFYEDDGETYNCERGERSLIQFTWSESKQQLTIAKREGQYKGMPENRTFIVMFPDGQQKTVKYFGKKTIMRKNNNIIII